MDEELFNKSHYENEFYRNLVVQNSVVVIERLTREFGEPHTINVSSSIYVSSSRSYCWEFSRHTLKLFTTCPDGLQMFVVFGFFNHEENPDVKWLYAFDYSPKREAELETDLLDRFIERVKMATRGKLIRCWRTPIHERRGKYYSVKRRDLYDESRFPPQYVFRPYTQEEYDDWVMKKANWWERRLFKNYDNYLTFCTSLYDPGDASNFVYGWMEERR